MDLNDLLADIEGITGDRFIASAQQTVTPPVSPVDPASPSPAGDPASAATGVSLAQVLGPVPAATPPMLGTLELVQDIELMMTVELGRARVPLRELLQYQSGDQLSLVQRTSDPLYIYINDRLIAHGEALVLDGTLAIRITELLPAPSEHRR